MENNTEERSLILSERELPHSIEAEQSVIGAIISDPSVISYVAENIQADFFYNEQHKKLYTIIMRMFAAGQPIDIITILNESVKQQVFESDAQARRYLAEIGNTLPSTSNIGSYCKIVSDKYYIRALGYAARDILEDVQSGEHDSQALLDAAEQKIYDIRRGKNTTGLVPLSDAIVEAYDMIGKITGPDKEKYMGARSGFSYLDNIISGLNRSDLIIIAARPAMGKTAFSMNIAVNVARKSGKDVVIFNLEMSKEQVATRILSTESMVDSNKLRNGRISGEDWVKLAESVSYLSSLPLFIDDSGSITVQTMKAKLRRVRNLGLVVIDYLQLMDSASKSDNRVVVVSEITRQLKIMAKELDVPVILLSQLSRDVEKRQDKRPILSDLRDSGSIEQDADIVLFLYREAYYKKDSQTPNLAECIIAKNRHGETGTVSLVWDGQYTRFTEADLDEIDMS